MPLTIHIHPADNVVVALRPLARGTAVELPDCGQTVTAAEDIPQGHKMAVSPIQRRRERRQIRLPDRPRDGRYRPRRLGAHPQPQNQPFG